MSPERSADLAVRRARRLARGLPQQVAERRVAELEADLHDHIAHERAAGVPESRIAWAIAGRVVRGIPSDASWRRRALAAAEAGCVRDARRGRGATARGVAPVVLGVLLALVVADAVLEGMVWSPFDFGVAAVLLTGAGVLLRRAVHAAGRPVHRLAVGGLGLAAGVAGQADDAPGLVLFGGLLLAAAVAMTAHRTRSSR